MNARAAITTLPEHEQPLSERYRISANAWCDADAKARRLEELKTVMIEQRKAKFMLAASQRGEKVADNAAEREVKASEDWQDYIESMVHARTIAKVEMETIKMLEREVRDRNESIRAEMRLSR